MSDDNPARETRVAIYIRIGGSGEYTTTFDMQKAYYKKIITEKPDWQLVGLYADFGYESRKQLNLKRLLDDCKAGQVDLIVTKSISRFTRSAEGLSKTLLELKHLKKPVGIYFEQEGINSLEGNNYLCLSLLAAITIAESESIRKPLSRKASTLFFSRGVNNEQR